MPVIVAQVPFLGLRIPFYYPAAVVPGLSGLQYMVKALSGMGADNG
ncbi:MAG: hypothetical protein JXJ19_09380 [Elusimicrobia bacterium]|nr:hypothetical protein [Elusimicrobiota bacterium]